MPRAAQRKDRPLAMRFPDADLAIIDRAASQRGRSRTEFVRDAAVRAAEERAGAEASFDGVRRLNTLVQHEGARWARPSITT